MNEIIDIGARRELFIDQFLIESLEGVAFKMHTPQLALPAAGGSPCGHYMSVLLDGGCYRAYYRQIDPRYTGDQYDGHPGEITCLAESDDGINWRFPALGLFEADGTHANNAILRMAPFSHNFAPFVDRNPRADPAAEQALEHAGQRDRFGARRRRRLPAPGTSDRRYQHTRGFQPSGGGTCGSRVDGTRRSQG